MPRPHAGRPGGAQPSGEEAGGCAPSSLLGCVTVFWVRMAPGLSLSLTRACKRFESGTSVCSVCQCAAKAGGKTRGERDGSDDDGDDVGGARSGWRVAVFSCLRACALGAPLATARPTTIHPSIHRSIDRRRARSILFRVALARTVSSHLPSSLFPNARACR